MVLIVDKGYFVLGRDGIGVWQNSKNVPGNGGVGELPDNPKNDKFLQLAVLVFASVGDEESETDGDGGFMADVDFGSDVGFGFDGDCVMTIVEIIIN